MLYTERKKQTLTKTMVKIKSEGEYLLKYGAGSIDRKYSQNSRVPSHATFTGLPSAPIPPVLTASIPATAAFNSQVPPPLAPPPLAPPGAGTTAPPSVAPTSGPNNAPPGPPPSVILHTPLLRVCSRET